MMIRARWKVGGGHTHIRVFVGEGENFTFAKAGDLCFRNEEWEWICPELKRAGWQILPEDEPAERGILFASEGNFNSGKCPETKLHIRFYDARAQTEAEVVAANALGKRLAEQLKCDTRDGACASTEQMELLIACRALGWLGGGE